MALRPRKRLKATCEPKVSATDIHGVVDAFVRIDGIVAAVLNHSRKPPHTVRLESSGIREGAIFRVD